jgi:hypothetical protein
MTKQNAMLNPAGIPNGCLYFRPEQMKDDYVGQEGDEITFFYGTRDLGERVLFTFGGGRGADTAESIGKGVSRVYAAIMGRYCPEHIEIVQTTFDDVPIERVYDGISLKSVTKLIDDGRLNVVSGQLDEIILKEQYVSRS